MFEGQEIVAAFIVKFKWNHDRSPFGLEENAAMSAAMLDAPYVA